MDKFKKLREQAEVLINKAEQQDTDFDAADLKTILHELEVSRIELEIQNEELRESQAGLDISRQEYFELFEYAPIGYAVLNSKGIVEQVNKTGVTLFGFSKEQLIGTRLSSFVLPPGITFIKPFEKTVLTGQRQSSDVEFIKQGGRFWVRMDFSLQQNSKNKNERVLCAFNDITRQRETEQELSIHRNELEQLVTRRTLELEDEIEKRKSSEGRIAESLREKEVLLREIHHRVKNNMQVIISLLRLQARKIKDEHITEVLKESQNRVKAMAVIHETLYKQNSLSNIDLQEYFTNLTANLVRVYTMTGIHIRTEIETNEIELDIDRAIPCGLIVNELISNSLKYAFPKKTEGKISIRIKPVENHNIELLVKDNGIGLPENIDPRNSETLGLSTVFSLAERQLGAQVQIKREQGTEFSIILPDNAL